MDNVGPCRAVNGVEHKEYLKRLRTEVDVLGMSATPIPRSLEMGVAGIREMSTILTPPEERHPVLTFVGAYDEKRIAAAIRREFLRDGQVFFVHNPVESICRLAQHTEIGAGMYGALSRGAPSGEALGSRTSYFMTFPLPGSRCAQGYQDERDSL